MMYRHPREFDAGLKFLAYAASRPGEFLVPTSISLKSSTDVDSMRWKDLAFKLVGWDESVQVTILMKLRLLKGNRTKDAEYKEVVLMQDLSETFNCPVLPLLAMALEDQAFIQFKESNEIYQCKVPIAERSL